jgi:hypothetical protein
MIESFRTPASRQREMGGKSPSRRAISPPMRLSRPRAPISRPSLRNLLHHIQHHGPFYQRLGDLLLGAGIVSVLLTSAYLLIFASR